MLATSIGAVQAMTSEAAKPDAIHLLLTASEEQISSIIGLELKALLCIYLLLLLLLQSFTVPRTTAFNSSLKEKSRCWLLCEIGTFSMNDDLTCCGVRISASPVAVAIELLSSLSLIVSLLESLKELDTQKTKQLRSQEQVPKLREGQAGQELGVFSSSLNEPSLREEKPASVDL
ncbi:hypothetical protein C4D60_Mb07t21820 [Musa balbisiana]|uniref:Uncharacterized protein n=1 Tax=Musa balbisiana TaxID=52838 RepID=A0A4S8JH22_MUSBA|nr:hypothetical protein C4D60_Mb07t21820 [Musa balbisiana]